MGGSARVARPPFAGRRILVGVTGGIAAFKSISLARELALAGAEVDVVLTSGALEFVQPLSFEALTGRPVHSDLYTPGDPLLHIRLARESDLIVVAPATANFIARAAAGFADDLLTAILLATRAPVLFAPAMNDRMYSHPQTRQNVARLEEIGYRRVGPAEGMLAWGEGEGEGRMLEPELILEHAGRELGDGKRLDGKHVLVTAGPTREAIDPVRFIGNRSSGRMGFAVAASAWRAGARVTLISGPTHLPTPVGVRRVDVETAEQMREAVAAALPEADVLVMAAAVADFRPAAPASQKIKKGGEDPDPIVLERTADVLRSTAPLRKRGAIIVGFALETENQLANGARKLAEKSLDMLVLNSANEEGAGFDVPTNRVTILTPRGGVEELPLMSKDAVGDRIIAQVTSMLALES